GPEALAAYREKATNTWAVVRWIGVAIVVAGLMLAVWAMNNGGNAPAKAGALALSLTGMVVLAVAVWRRKAYHRARETD
ncbi:MAG: hypothetical protein ACXW3D_05745, partial [Caulobacteraceae bacterium]